CLVFFFSSRRRHTRSYGDWSSDVCSSDLLLPEYVEEITEDEVIFRNYEGKRFVYKQPRQVAAESGCDPLAPAAQNDVVPIQIGKDRKSTRLNSSHRTISYAVFCLKKKKKK